MGSARAMTPRRANTRPVRGAMRSGLFLPLFGELADPAAVARLSAGWHPDATLAPMTRAHVWRIDEGGQPR